MLNLQILDRMASTSDENLQKMLDAQSRDMKLYFAEQLTIALKPLNEDIASLKSELQARNKEIDNLKSEMEEVKSVNKELVSVTESLKARLVTSEKFQAAALESFKQLESKLEDRTNRQLRQTIVVKGLPEKKDETWTDTRNTLAKHISKAYNIEFKKVYSMFERVHRGGGDGYNNSKKGRRDIYALCSHWDDSELLVWGSFDANKKIAKKDRIFIDYKYGPLTTLRRGQALKKRKEILEQKLYRNAFVKFPAVLMARKEGEDAYSKIEDFSNVDVSKLPVVSEFGHI